MVHSCDHQNALAMTPATCHFRRMLLYLWAQSVQPLISDDELLTMGNETGFGCKYKEDLLIRFWAFQPNPHCHHNTISLLTIQNPHYTQRGALGGGHPVCTYLNSYLSHCTAKGNQVCYAQATNVDLYGFNCASTLQRGYVIISVVRVLWGTATWYISGSCWCGTGWVAVYPQLSSQQPSFELEVTI